MKRCQVRSFGSVLEAKQRRTSEDKVTKDVRCGHSVQLWRPNRQRIMSQDKVGLTKDVRSGHVVQLKQRRTSEDKVTKDARCGHSVQLWRPISDRRTSKNKATIEKMSGVVIRYSSGQPIRQRIMSEDTVGLTKDARCGHTIQLWRPSSEERQKTR